ncbi:Fe-S cluster domain-containing protein [Parabacteroides sp. FAFU027]|uniref:Fe-S cluster domain-containing protein n=1 Tax=Parabacteroides sp. FAFU027 TaxID=2922715 RepID=UPI001FAFCF74|nr:Fe-S cluster domain-containing protein [Parabacteroides sp. FAFU027]
MSIILISVILLAIVGGTSAIILYVVANRFQVVEDKRVNLLEEILPAANCGGCGYPGCHGFAEACVKASSLNGLRCPVGGDELMSRVGGLLGFEVQVTAPMIAVVRCNGSCDNRPRTSQYDGAKSCAVESMLYGGETGCSFGCLSHGDCVKACMFDAIYINEQTLLPEVVEDKCTACGACVKACPKNIIELRKKGEKSHRIFVNCVNKDKGAISRKACSVSCIACSKCRQVCSYNAITIANNLAYIDCNLCTLCRACVEVCPTSAIAELNFPPQKKTEAEE